MIAAGREDVDYIDLHALHNYLTTYSPDLVINTAMLTPPKSVMTDVVLINSYFPHLLQSVTATIGIKMIQLSTESVFSGHSRNPNTVRSTPDPTTYFGKSRSLGEVVAGNVCVVRTSWVWRDSSMVKSLLAARGTIDGWVNYLWSGSTVGEVANALLDLSLNFKPGIVHISTERPISKYDVTLILQMKLGCDLRVTPTEFPALNRALAPTISIKPFEEAIYADDSFANLCPQPA